MEYLLTIRKIAHYTVLVPSIPPRQALLLLGIDYRKIPVLSINDTVYCDTFKIAEALESLYEDSDEHPSLFPKSLNSIDPNSLLQKLLVQFWTDRPLFTLVVTLLPFDELGKDFIEDREKLMGARIDVNHLKRMKPHVISQLRIHLMFIEQTLRGSRNGFILQTDKPGYFDVSVYFILRWIHTIGGDEDLYGPKESSNFDSLQKWAGRMQIFYEKNKIHAPATRISGHEANRKIPEPPSMGTLVAKTDDERLFGLGYEVKVVPDDWGQISTHGKLVAIDNDSIVLIVKRRDGTDRGCKVCFPRLGFKVLPKDSKTSKM